jgi:hypothetical protein
MLTALRREFAVGGHLVDGLRQMLRQQFGDFIGGKAHLGGQVLHRVGAEHLMNLIRRDRQILSLRNP